MVWKSPFQVLFVQLLEITVVQGKIFITEPYPLLSRPLIFFKYQKRTDTPALLLSRT
jgi:hypothetical protein